jgi:hypothetical protein
MSAFDTSRTCANVRFRPLLGKKADMCLVEYYDMVQEDPLDLKGQLTEDERMVRDTARGYARDKFTLAAVAQNLRRLAKLIARPPPAAAARLA